MKKKTNNKTLLLIVAMFVFCLITLGSCGNSYGQKTLYLADNSSSGSGCFGGNSNSKSKSEWLVEQITVGRDSTRIQLIKDENKTIEDANTRIAEINGLLEAGGSDEAALTTEKNTLEANIETSNAMLKDYYVENLRELISSYVNFNAIAKSNEEDKISENYLVCIIKNDIVDYQGYINNVTTYDISSIDNVKSTLNGTNGCVDVKNKKAANEALDNVSTATDAYLIAALFMINAENRFLELEPIRFNAYKDGKFNFGVFMGHLWNNLFIFPIGWLLFSLSKLCGGYYVIGLIITTLLIRTLGWPIYAKSNDMSAKMGELQPELQKIQEKYAGRTDQESQRMMQMEQAKLYKDNKIGLGGCLMPFLQFPIFMAVYRGISRLPYTREIAGTNYTLTWATQLKSTALGIDLFADRSGGGERQLIGILVLLVLVVGTQIVSQLLTQHNQKKMNDKKQEDIPEYRRQAYNQTQNQSQKSMKLMLWFMIFMMGTFVWSSKAGLGFYWLIGNLYSMVQMVINAKKNEKNLEKKRQEKGIYTVKTK